MKPSDHDPDYVNSSLRKKANLMRLSRSPAKLRPSANAVDGPNAQGGKVNTYSNAPTNMSTINPSSSSMAVTMPNLRTTPVTNDTSKTQPIQSLTSAQSNRSSVFRSNTVHNFRQTQTPAVIEEDESSEYLHEESTPMGQMRIVSYGQAGELQFKPAGAPLIQGINAHDLQESRKTSSFQTRFKNAAIASLQTKQMSPLSKPSAISAPAGISWDNIIENVGPGNNRTPSTYDSRGRADKRGEYEKFDDCSSVGTEIYRDNAHNAVPMKTNLSGTSRKDLLSTDAKHTNDFESHDSTTSKNRLDKKPQSTNLIQNFSYGSKKIHQSQSSSITAVTKPLETNHFKRLDAELVHNNSLKNKSISKDDHAAHAVRKPSLPDSRRSNLRNDQQFRVQSEHSTRETQSFGESISSTKILKTAPESKNNSTGSKLIYVNHDKDVVDLDEIPRIDETKYSQTSNQIHAVNSNFSTAHDALVLETSQLQGSKFTSTKASHDTKARTQHASRERNTLSQDVFNRKIHNNSSENVTIPANNIKGFRGFIEKTKGTPALADYDSDSVVTVSTTADMQDDPARSSVTTSVQQGKSPGAYNITSDPSVFQERAKHMISSSLPSLNPTGKLQPMTDSTLGVDGMNFARIGNTLSAIVTTPEAFQKRMVNTETFSDSDSLLDRKSNVNDLAFNGEVPDFNNDLEASSHSDFSVYLVDPLQVQALVRKYRKISDALVECGYDPVMQEDAKKAFALFEMRSRIMETDIERGLGRCGGTTIVDDMVITEFYKEMYRVRDAVIVSKAWRDGASPKDAFTAMALTRKAYTYAVRKPRRNRSQTHNKMGSGSTSLSHNRSSLSWVWEEVLWVDDTDFTLLRCPSLGARLMRGSEIFTISDCQSILLKLTHERCEQLRQELNEAATLQLYAKEMMKEEAEFNDLLGVEGMMTDLEMKYLSTTEQVKSISKQLVLAEKAFTMVKERVERLVHKYEHILEQIDHNGELLISNDENESVEPDEVYMSEDENNEKGRLERRAERAELKAEVAAREALMLTVTVEKTKQEAEKIRREKEQEIFELQKRLDELEKKSAFIAREYESKLSLKILEKAKLLTQSQSGSKETRAMSVHSVDDDVSAAKERIKARFRTRSAQKDTNTPQQDHPGTESNRPTRNSFHQRLEFYERSLRSIEKP